MKIGMYIFDGIAFEKQVEYFKKYGIDRTFLENETAGFDDAVKLFKNNGITIETLHAPFNGINDMWSDDEEAGTKMLNRLKDTVDKCAKYGVPVAVVHVSSGRPMPEITENGIKRYEEIFAYAKEKGVTVALENLRYMENLEFFMDRYEEPGFCWDNGHEYCYTKGKKFMDKFSKRLSALHIHDNRACDDNDDHLLPFDGKIDFEEVAKALADSGYEGTLMLEITKTASVDGIKIYERYTDEEYIERAVASARKLSDMVEKFKSL